MKTDEDNMTRGAFWNLIFFSFNKMASNKSSPNLAPMIYIYPPLNIVSPTTQVKILKETGM